MSILLLIERSMSVCKMNDLSIRYFLWSKRTCIKNCQKDIVLCIKGLVWSSFLSQYFHLHQKSKNWIMDGDIDLIIDKYSKAKICISQRNNQNLILRIRNRYLYMYIERKTQWINSNACGIASFSHTFMNQKLSKYVYLNPW